MLYVATKISLQKNIGYVKYASDILLIEKIQLHYSNYLWSHFVEK